MKESSRFDLGLNRKGAIRQRKEEVHEMYGHKFIVQQFYNIMRCALCGDFLKYAAGMQCADCKYTCHKKCYSKVVTKCISKSNNDMVPEEEKLNHRIPHRFEAFSNMGANWCCHCGYVLPLGRKNCRKCTGTSRTLHVRHGMLTRLECSLTCHAQCLHFVPLLGFSIVCSFLTAMAVACLSISETRLVLFRRDVQSDQVSTPPETRPTSNMFCALLRRKQFKQK